MWRKADLAKFRAQRGPDRRLLLEALLWLGVARLAIVTVPFRWIVRLFSLRPGEGPTGSEETSASNHLSDELAERIAWALKAASARSPWQSTCLAQALAGAAMLRRRRISAILAMGVAKSSAAQGALKAHAWLSCGEVVLTGSAGRGDYNVIARYAPRGLASD
jgi:hypothetical protein